MITSRLMPLTLSTRSSSLALPSGLSTDLSKSKKASAAYVTLVAAGGCAAGAGAGAAGRAAGAAGAAAGAGAGAWTTRAPSQPTAAVAGVQKLSRQQYSLVPFFQTSSLVPFSQLSMRLPPSAACTRVPIGGDVDQPASSAADAISSATLLRFFMVLLLRGKSRSRAA